MIDRHLKFKLPDENKEKEFTMEVNWDLKDSKTNECKIVKFTFPNGDVAMVKKEYLHAALFAIGKREEQMKMIPQKDISVKWYETVIGIKATKDIHKGEMINIPIKLSLPTREEEAIAELKADYEQKQILRTH